MNKKIKDFTLEEFANYCKAHRHNCETCEIPSKARINFCDFADDLDERILDKEIEAETEE